MAFVLAACLPAACAFDQVELGRWYILYTPKQEACPVLEWRFVVDAQRAIDGSLGSSGGLKLADLSGTLNADDSFQLNATLAGGGSAGLVTGRFNQSLTTFTLKGDFAGPACDGQTLRLRYIDFYGPRGGGGGSG